MSGNVDKHKDIFREEAQELLVELEAALLELEESPGDEQLVDRIFRALHTIKGSGSMFGFDDVSSFAHELESVFDLIRNGKVKVTQDLIDISLSARDLIREMLADYEKGQARDPQKTASLTAALKEIVPEMNEETHGVPPLGSARAEARSEKAVSPEQGDMITYRIRFHPGKELFLNGTNPISLLNAIRQLGNCAIIAHMDSIPALETMNPENCYTYWDLILTTERGINAIRDVFIFVEDACELKIDVIDEGGKLDNEQDYKKLGEILLEREDITSDVLLQTLAGQRRLGELLVDAGLVNARKIDSALLEQQYVKEIRQKRQTADLISSVRVSSERLDNLVNLVGELVTVQARLSQTSVSWNDPGLISIAEEVERLTAELRDITMSIRMVPIGTTFSKFKRLVRDLSRELGKEVELKTEGAETEIDKNVIERLNDPMVHIIRNSIGHGIELPSVREAAGKQKQGTIHLSAVHSGAHVLISVRDDGSGLDKSAIKQKALDKGLIAPGEELTDHEIYALILAPGFSTAKEITNVYGRGVGMDVVKKAIDELRGSIEIESSEGRGTTVTLRIPLTLAIIEGLLVMIGDEQFVLPLSSVEECVELTRGDVAKTHGRDIANVRGEIVPYIRLREQFGIGGERPDIEQIVIASSNETRVGFVVDTVIGGHQTVIKSLGKMHRDIQAISGATVLGDGTVALILDIPALVQVAEQEEGRRRE